MKKILHKAFLLVLVFSLYSCSREVNPVGEYASKGSPDSFIFKDDYTFSYRYKFEFDYKYSDGYWSRKTRRQIVLRSRLKSKILPLSIQEYDTSNEENYMKIRINMNQDYRKYYYCSVFVNDSFFVKKNCDSLSLIRITAPISSIFFKLNADEKMPARFLDSLTTEKYLLKKSRNVNLEVNILYTDSLVNYRLFNDESIKLTGRGIKFYKPQVNKWSYLPRIK